MRRIFIIFCLIVVAATATIQFTTSCTQANACNDCDLSINRKCGVCKKTNAMFSDNSREDEYKNGYLYQYYKCKYCGHTATKKTKY